MDLQGTADHFAGQGIEFHRSFFYHEEYGAHDENPHSFVSFVSFVVTFRQAQDLHHEEHEGHEGRSSFDGLRFVVSVFLMMNRRLQHKPSDAV